MKIFNPNITGSLEIDATISGSIQGDALWPSASYAVSASYAENGGSTPGGSGVGDTIFLYQNFK